MHLSELKSLHVSQLIEMATALEIENPQRMRKQELMFAILKRKARTGETIFGDGCLEVLARRLRLPALARVFVYRELRRTTSRRRRSAASTCIPATLERGGAHAEGRRALFRVVKVVQDQRRAARGEQDLILFENSRRCTPTSGWCLSARSRPRRTITGRIIDMIARSAAASAVIVAPPKAGKMVMMQHIAHAITPNTPTSSLVRLIASGPRKSPR